MEDEILMKEIINPLININSDLYEVTLDNFIMKLLKTYLF